MKIKSFLNVKVKKLHPDAVIPTYATYGSACFDLHSVESGKVFPGGYEYFGTCLSFEVPEDHVMLIYSRSGHGFKNSVRLANATGIIDSDYRGEVKVKLHNDHSSAVFEVEAGDRIAQAMVIPVNQARFELVEELSETERGAGGFGSTDKK
jgi:dUTP pyrophosphatase